MLSKWWIPGGSHACPPSSLLEGHPPLDTPRSVDNPPEHEVGYALSARSLQARWVEISASLGSGSGCSATPLPPLAQRSISPAMNCSTFARHTSSEYCSGGDFMKYDDADRIGPPMPRSLAIFAARMASMMIPAEFGESQTSSLYSRLTGASPKFRPSRRMNAHLRSSSQAT